MFIGYLNFICMLGSKCTCFPVHRTRNYGFKPSIFINFKKGKMMENMIHIVSFKHFLHIVEGFNQMQIPFSAKVNEDGTCEITLTGAH